MGARKQDWGTGLQGWLWQLWHDLDQSRMVTGLWLHLNHWNCKKCFWKTSFRESSFLLETGSSLVQFFNMVWGWLLLRPPPRERFRTPHHLSRHPVPYSKFLSPLTFYNGLSFLHPTLEPQTKSSCAQTRRIIIPRLPFVASKHRTLSLVHADDKPPVWLAGAKMLKYTLPTGFVQLYMHIGSDQPTICLLSRNELETSWRVRTLCSTAVWTPIHTRQQRLQQSNTPKF